MRSKRMHTLRAVSSSTGQGNLLQLGIAFASVFNLCQLLYSVWQIESSATSIDRKLETYFDP